MGSMSGKSLIILFAEVCVRRAYFLEIVFFLAILWLLSHIFRILLGLSYFVNPICGWDFAYEIPAD